MPGTLNDMDTYSLTESAAALRTSMPRLRRAIRDLGTVPMQEGKERHLDASQFDALRKHLGYAAPVDGLTREEIFVLAALNLHPLGIRSIRAVARSASVSPTTAGQAVTHLAAKGLVAAQTERVIEGAAIDAPIWRVARDGPGWFEIAPAVRTVVLPSRGNATTRPKAVPRRLWHHFWNAEPSKLRLPTDSDYVAARLLRSDDPQALSWAAANLDANSIEKAAGLRGLDDKRRSMIRHLAHV